MGGGTGNTMNADMLNMFLANTSGESVKSSHNNLFGQIDAQKDSRKDSQPQSPKISKNESFI